MTGAKAPGPRRGTPPRANAMKRAEMNAPAHNREHRSRLGDAPRSRSPTSGVGVSPRARLTHPCVWPAVGQRARASASPADSERRQPPPQSGPVRPAPTAPAERGMDKVGSASRWSRSALGLAHTDHDGGPTRPQSPGRRMTFSSTRCRGRASPDDTLHPGVRSTWRRRGSGAGCTAGLAGFRGDPSAAEPCRHHERKEDWAGARGAKVADCPGSDAWRCVEVRELSRERIRGAGRDAWPAQ